MKIKHFFMLFISMNVCANDAIIELLESNGISTAEMITETTHQMSGEETKLAISKLIKKNLFVQFSQTDSESEKGQCLAQTIVGLFNGYPESQEPIIEPVCRSPRDHGYIDPPSHIDASLAVEMAWATCHLSAYSHDVKYLFDHDMVPQFIGPHNLLTIIDDLDNYYSIIKDFDNRLLINYPTLTAALDDHLFSGTKYQSSDGVVFRCNAMMLPDNRTVINLR